MEIPVIRIEDWSETPKPPLPVRYILGENELDFEAVYIKIKKLVNHPGRGAYQLFNHDEPLVNHPGSTYQLFNYDERLKILLLKQCDTTFGHAFFDCIAHLSDYFADFLAQDRALNQSIWFHLLDELQEVGKLPHAFWKPEFICCMHSQAVATEYSQALQLINEVISPRKTPADSLVQPRTGQVDAPNCCLGSFKAGLKPWEQFLRNGSPGFGVLPNEHVYTHDPKRTLDGQVFEQYIPMGGLGIIQRHTDRARELTRKFARADLETRSEVELLARFDQHSFKIGEPFGYTSLDGHQVLVQPMRPARLSSETPTRLPGWEDHAWSQTNPNMKLLDECVGECRGTAPFARPDGDDEFSMWNVTSSCGDPTSYNHQQKVSIEEHSEMFDEWNVDEQEV